MDNLWKWRICIVEWCCLCKASGELPDHLLFHCTFAQAICSLVFCLFGISWVMPTQVIDLLASWMGGFSKSCLALVWGAVPHCVMRLLWREHNNRLLRDKRLLHWILNPNFLRTLLSRCL